MTTRRYAILNPDDTVRSVVILDQPPRERHVALVDDTPPAAFPGDGWVLVVQDGSLRWLDRRTEEERNAADLVRIDKDRSREEWGGFAHAGKSFASDPAAQARIAVLAIGALRAQAAGQAYAVDYLTTSNELVVLDAAGVLALADALALHVSRTYASARLRRRVNKPDQRPR